MTNDASLDLVMRKPDDFHVHFRDGAHMDAVIGYTAKQFARAIIMPNLKPPVVNTKMATDYFNRIEESLQRANVESPFTALMTIYLTDETTPRDIENAKRSGIVYAAKLYPANATTNSAHGVTDITKLASVLKAMEQVGLILCVHGETLVSREYGDKTRNGRVGQLRREAVFLKETSSWIVDNFPKLKLVHEHITTREAVEFVKKAPSNVGATITAHHLLETLDAVFESHHNKCMPVLKEEEHRQALLGVVSSGHPRFFGEQTQRLTLRRIKIPTVAVLVASLQSMLSSSTLRLLRKLTLFNGLNRSCLSSGQSSMVFRLTRRLLCSLERHREHRKEFRMVMDIR